MSVDALNRVVEYNVGEGLEEITKKMRDEDIKPQIEILARIIKECNCTTYEKLYKSIRTFSERPNIQISVSTCYNIINALNRLYNAHVETFLDLKDALNVLKSYPWEITLDEIADALYAMDNQKYAYKDEDEAYNVFITDTDFVDLKSLRKSEYDIIYRVFEGCDSNYLHDAIVYKYNRMKSPILRKTELKLWGEVIKAVIEKLESFSNNHANQKIMVIIPFFYYRADIQDTIQSFKIVENIISFLNENAFCELPLEDASYDESDIMPLKDAMWDYMDYCMCDLDNGQELADAIYYEIVRRGFEPNRKEEKENTYRKLLRVSNKSVKSQKEDISKNTDLQSVREEPIIKKASVIYYMLKDKIDITLMHKVIHFATNAKKEYKGSNASDTIYTYLQHPKDRFLDKVDKIDYIKENLTKYKYTEEDIEKLLNVDE